MVSCPHARTTPTCAPPLCPSPAPVGSPRSSPKPRVPDGRPSCGSLPPGDGDGCCPGRARCHSLSSKRARPRDQQMACGQWLCPPPAQPASSGPSSTSRPPIEGPPGPRPVPGPAALPTVADLPPPGCCASPRRAQLRGGRVKLLSNQRRPGAGCGRREGSARHSGVGPRCARVSLCSFPPEGRVSHLWASVARKGAIRGGRSPAAGCHPQESEYRRLPPQCPERQPRLSAVTWDTHFPLGENKTDLGDEWPGSPARSDARSPGPEPNSGTGALEPGRLRGSLSPGGGRGGEDKGSASWGVGGRARGSQGHLRVPGVPGRGRGLLCGKEQLGPAIPDPAAGRGQLPSPRAGQQRSQEGGGGGGGRAARLGVVTLSPVTLLSPQLSGSGRKRQP